VVNGVIQTKVSGVTKYGYNNPKGFRIVMDVDSAYTHNFNISYLWVLENIFRVCDPVLLA
jgi:hypothetical protein